MDGREADGMTCERDFAVEHPIELVVQAYLWRSERPCPLLPMVLRTELEPTVRSRGDDGEEWLERRRRFWTAGDLPRWLAGFVGGADVVIREDARWRVRDTSQPRLELYTVNDSHAHLIRVQEWCTYTSDGKGRTRKTLHVAARVLVRPWWLLGLEKRLEAFLVRRWLHSLQLGLRADGAICDAILAERAGCCGDAASLPAEATPAAASASPADARRFPPAPRSPLKLAGAAAALSSPSPVRLPPRRKLRLMPLISTVTKLGAAALLVRALPVAFAARR